MKLNFYPVKIMKKLIDWKKVFANHISDRGLISRLYKEISKQQQKKTTANKLENG